MSFFNKIYDFTVTAIKTVIIMMMLIKNTGPHLNSGPTSLVDVTMHTLNRAASTLSSSAAFLSGDGDATIVDSGLANCDGAGDLEFTSPRRDDTEFAVCRLTAEHKRSNRWLLILTLVTDCQR